MKNDIIIFRNGELELEVTISEDRETVWLSANQMSALFDRDEKTIRKHINNVFKEKEVNKKEPPSKTGGSSFNAYKAQFPATLQSVCRSATR